MRVAIHQPQYISYIGYFNKILRSDLFIYFDDCQYQDRGFQNRNLVLNYGKYRWISIPILEKKRRNIDEIKIDNSSNWQVKHLEILINSYGKSKYFKNVFEGVDVMYRNRWDDLSTFLIDYDNVVCEMLSIKTKRVKSSNLKLPRNLKATDRLIAICKKVDADQYLSGQGGRNYMEVNKFAENKIVIEYQKFSGEYVKSDSNPSILDFLFNYGPMETKRIVSSIYDNT